MALIARWRPSSPLDVSRQIASMIWVGAARNSGLATSTRLISSHSSSPASTDSRPAMPRNPCQERTPPAAAAVIAGLPVAVPWLVMSRQSASWVTPGNTMRSMSIAPGRSPSATIALARLASFARDTLPVGSKNRPLRMKS